MIERRAVIPEPTPTGELPPGQHQTTLTEIGERYATNPTRQHQFEGLTRAAHALAQAGATTLWINGSYITTKGEPGDYDATFDAQHINWTTLGLNNPELMDFDNPRTTQKRVYGGELLPNIEGGIDYVAFFQTNRDGNPKGILRIDLTELT